jgi:hypothetical protein
MKTINVILFSVICLSLSCKKDTGKVDCWFNLNPPDIYRDSISSIVINYSVYSDFKDEGELMNPDIYQYSINTDLKRSNCDIYPCSIDYGSITLDIGKTYVIKKFDLVDSSGKILFNLTWKPDSIHGALDRIYLPYVFNATSKISFTFSKLGKSSNNK